MDIRNRYQAIKPQNGGHYSFYNMDIDIFGKTSTVESTRLLISDASNVIVS